MSAWGDATTYHSPNQVQSNLYSYGLVFVIRGNPNDSEKRILQIYYPHKVESGHPVYCRMHNGSSTDTGWQDWHRIARESPKLDGTGATGSWGISITGNAATSTKVAAKLASTNKTYLLGTQTAITSTAANVDLTGDTGVYLTTTAGELSALKYSVHDTTSTPVEKVRMEWNSTTQSLNFVFV